MLLEFNQSEKVFYTPERFAREQVHHIESPRGQLLIATCRSGAYLAERVVQRYGQSLVDGGANGNVLYLENVDYNFSDTLSRVINRIHYNRPVSELFYDEE